jgi:TonB family protein
MAQCSSASEIFFSMKKSSRYIQAFVALSLFLPPTCLFRAQDVIVPATTGHAIVSPSHPQDSRGETVYEIQGESQKDQPLVPGELTHPVPVKMRDSKYPKSMKKAKSAADVAILCTVTANGDVVDESIESSSDTDASASALAAVQQYRFKPATLDGRPVASLLRIVVKFRIK